MKRIGLTLFFAMLVCAMLCIFVSANTYDFAVLKYVDKDTDGIVAYVDVDGVEKRLVLAEENAAFVGDKTYDAKHFYSSYKQDRNSDGTFLNPYTIITRMENTAEGYVLHINENLDESVYTVVPSGATLSYNPKTKLYSISGASFSLRKLSILSSAKLYFTYIKPLVSSEEKFLGMYTVQTVSKNDFTVKTCGETYIMKKENGNYYLVTTLIDGEIEGSVPPEGSGELLKGSYVEDGRLIYYAPEGSSLELIDGKIYNSYVFKDPDSLMNAPSFPDTVREWNKVDNNGSVAGNFYGWNPLSLNYERLTAETIGKIDSVKLVTLTDVITSTKLIEYNDGKNTDMEVVDNSVKIWGISARKDSGVYSYYTLKQLSQMLQSANKSNKANSGSVEINLLMFYYKDKNDGNVLHSIFVEVFNKDNKGNVYSVNDIVFRNLGIASDVTPPISYFGDANADGVVELKDVTLLRRYIAGGYGVTVDENAMDVNGDGAVDLKDVTALRRYIAGGYGIKFD